MTRGHGLADEGHALAGKRGREAEPSGAWPDRRDGGGDQVANRVDGLGRGARRATAPRRTAGRRTSATSDEASANADCRRPGDRTACTLPGSSVLRRPLAARRAASYRGYAGRVRPTIVVPCLVSRRSCPCLSSPQVSRRPSHQRTRSDPQRARVDGLEPVEVARSPPGRTRPVRRPLVAEAFCGPPARSCSGSRSGHDGCRHPPRSALGCRGHGLRLASPCGSLLRCAAWTAVTSPTLGTTASAGRWSSASTSSEVRRLRSRTVPSTTAVIVSMRPTKTKIISDMTALLQARELGTGSRPSADR